MLPTRSTTGRHLVLSVKPDGTVHYPCSDTHHRAGVASGDVLPAAVVAELESGVDMVRVSWESGETDFAVYTLESGGGWLLISDFEATAGHSISGVPGVEEMAYRAFFEQAPVGIVHLDAEGRVTFENHALRQITGERPQDAWLGRSVRDISLLNDFVALLIDGVLSMGRTLDGAETEHQREDGTIRYLRIVGSPIRSFDGAVVGAVLTVQDVTQARLTEDLSRRARLAAEDASRMKSALIATISHELRTPAGTIHGYAKLLEQELYDLGKTAIGSEVPMEFAETIRIRAADLVRLVGDITELSQLETGTVTMQAEVLDVRTIVTEAVAGAKEEGPQSVTIRVDDAPRAFVVADRLRLRHVLDKLVGNALKFTSEGHVRIGWARDAEAVCIEISDTGVGIDHESLDRVFDPFRQEEDPLIRRFEGAGLGLSIVRRLVEMMSGRIQIESEKGVGTTVHLYLPSGDSEERWSDS